jgi:hypothetical protein
MVKSFFLPLTILPWTFHHANTKTAWNVGQVVSTSSGSVKGHAATLPGTQNVSEYLGIRFGEDTGGNNRFLKPEPYSGDTLIEASKFVSFVSLCVVTVNC